MATLTQILNCSRVTIKSRWAPFGHSLPKPEEKHNFGCAKTWPAFLFIFRSMQRRNSKYSGGKAGRIRTITDMEQQIYYKPVLQTGFEDT